MMGADAAQVMLGVALFTVNGTVADVDV